MKNIFYNTLVHIFYFIGDLISRSPDCFFRYDWVYNLYSWCMQKSQDFDEKLDYKYWKEPTENDKNL